MTVQPGTSGSFSGQRLQAGLQLGDYVLGQPLWPLRIADAYRANGPGGAATVYVIHAPIAQNAAVRDHVIAGTRAAAGLPEHKHLVRTLAAGLTGDILWIATEDIDGQLVRDMLVKKRQAGAAGFGVRGTANLITGVCAALADATHGALSSESVVVNRAGRVRVVDLALGPGTAAAVAAKLIAANASIAPEVLAGGAVNGATDVFSTGALMYEALVGSPLERGGPRPSDVVQGITKQVDDLVARACHKDPDKRFGRVDVLGEVVAEALGKGGVAVDGARMSAAIAVPEPGAGQSLAMSIAGAGADADTSPAASGNAVVDRALAAALADTNEKWLISKGRLDYGPFSLADVVAQIDKGDIVAGNLIMDKDTGARVDIGEHPLLGPVVDAARQRMDDQRRAQAEVAVQSAEKKRGAALYGVIFLAVAAVGVGGYFIIQSMRESDASKKAGTVSGLEGAALKVTVSLPKAPPKHTGGGGGGGKRNWGPGNTNENLSLDLSDDSDETETLGMDKVYAVYSHYGAQLGGCVGGGGSANISIIIDGPSGRVNFVKVNGQATGPLWGCINRVMRSMQFPTIHGPRTRAEFDIGT